MLNHRKIQFSVHFPEQTPANEGDIYRIFYKEPYHCILNKAGETMINPIQSAYGLMTSLQANGRKEKEEHIQQQGIVRDVVNLSDKKEIFARFFKDQNIPFTSGKPVTIDDLKTGLTISEKMFREEMDSLFAKNGISTEPSITLFSDSEGKIKVDGEHPQKQQIEQLFEDNPQAGNAYRKVSALSGLVEAAEEQVKFAEEYRIDPQAATAKYSKLFNSNHEGRFSMIFGEQARA